MEPNQENQSRPQTQQAHSGAAQPPPVPGTQPQQEQQQPPLGGEARGPDLRDSTLTRQKEETLFSWRAPERPFKKRNKEFYTTVLAVGFLVAVILFFIEGLMPVIVVAAIVFLVWILATVQPLEVEHKLTTRGVYFAGRLHPWEEFTRFWFVKRFENELLVLETISFPGRVEMVVEPASKTTLQEKLEDYLTHEEAAPGFLDKAASWFSKRIPLEG